MTTGTVLWFIIIGVLFYLMMKRGGCCGGGHGHAHGPGSGKRSRHKEEEHGPGDKGGCH